MSFSVIQSLPTPQEVINQYALSDNLKSIKARRDAEIKNIFEDKEDKMVLVIGPCSADCEKSVLEYVLKLADLQEKVKEKLLLIPRIYTNKPRTNGLGYKGIMHQPNPKEKPNIANGLLALRRLHLKCFSESGLSAADEMLYPDVLGYLDDLLSYIAVGARSVENQQHRLVSSGVDVPVGMKNPTSGDLSVMFNAIYAAQNQHAFAYKQTEVHTSGNPLTHVILRGYSTSAGESISNYHYEDLKRVDALYKKHPTLQNPAIVVDTNHANSGKNYKEQPRIAYNVMESRADNPVLKKLVKGLMIESYLQEGRQEVGEGIYGKSITDACLGWNDTEKLVYNLAEMV
ncbi:MAG: 3-deoxy-7-phosphoheptulonate synthase [Alphaproteobacteria bacterium]|nr:3-deoxy-7-phosphoheptulonate synthase [Alphaproteobacteria bacterium]